MGVAALTVALALAASARSAPEADALQRPLGECTVDWTAGEVMAHAGAAADIRMPSVDAARSGAERRARAAASTKLRAALALLPITGHTTLTEARIDEVMAKARVDDVEYQSNGGVLLTMRIGFSDLFAATVSEVVLSAPHAPLEVCPLLLVDGLEVKAVLARYRVGAPPHGGSTLVARRDRSGRLVIGKDQVVTVENLVQARLVIYLGKEK